MAGDGISFTPQWRIVERYAQRWAATKHWRVKLICDDVDDALGECMFVYAKCARIYTGKVDNPAWFMALYKRALANYWVYLQRHNRYRARGLEAIRKATLWAPQRSEPAIAVLFTALTEVQFKHQLRGQSSDVLELLLSAPHDTFPQCGRIAAHAATHDLHTMLEAA